MMATKNIAVVCALAVCIAGSVWMATAGKRDSTTYTYSQFMDQVHKGQVASAVILGGNSGASAVTFRLKDGQTARTVLPWQYKDALRAMQESLVNVEIRDSASEPSRMLINASPFLLLLGVWIVLMWRFPNGMRRIFAR